MGRSGKKRDTIPCMIKGIQNTGMRPGVVGRVKTFFRRRICMYFTNEGKGAVEVCVPSSGADSN